MTRNLRTVWRPIDDDHEYGDVVPRAGDTYAVDEGHAFANSAELKALIAAGHAKWYSVAHKCSKCQRLLYQTNHDEMFIVGVPETKSITDPKTKRPRDVIVTMFFGDVWCLHCRNMVQRDARIKKEQKRAQATVCPQSVQA